MSEFKINNSQFKICALAPHQPEIADRDVRLRGFDRLLFDPVPPFPPTRRLSGRSRPASSSARSSSSASRRSISFSDSMTEPSAVCRIRRLPAAVRSLDAAFRDAELMLLEPRSTENSPSTIPIFSSALRESQLDAVAFELVAFLVETFCGGSSSGPSKRFVTRPWLVSSARSAAARQRSTKASLSSPSQRGHLELFVDQHHRPVDSRARSRSSPPPF